MGMRVLLVEDSAELLNYMGELVASAGYDVLRANDGDQAMAVLREVGMTGPEPATEEPAGDEDDGEDLVGAGAARRRRGR